ncbi:MAG: DUF2933 domain-containing protein [Gammaproteobacteria bacterium]
MEWLTENWFWVLLGVGFIAMHLFGHGGHGGHKKQQDSEKDSNHRH